MSNSTRLLSSPKRPHQGLKSDLRFEHSTKSTFDNIVENGDSKLQTWHLVSTKRAVPRRPETLLLPLKVTSAGQDKSVAHCRGNFLVPCPRYPWPRPHAAQCLDHCHVAAQMRYPSQQRMR